MTILNESGYLEHLLDHNKRRSIMGKAPEASQKAWILSDYYNTIWRTIRKKAEPGKNDLEYDSVICLSGTAYSADSLQIRSSFLAISGLVDSGWGEGYRFTCLSSAGDTLEDIDFDLTYDSLGMDSMPLFLSFPFPAGADSITIAHGASTLYSASRSTSPPDLYSVSVSQVPGDSIFVEWSMHDDDSDNLKSDIFVKDPGQGCWVPLEVSSTDSNFFLTPLNVPACYCCSVAVSVCDGFNSAFLAGDSTFTFFMCGDINGDGNPTIDISDLVYLVDYMFLGGPEPPVMLAVDVDGSGGGIDIADLVYLVDYMFNQGPEPNCL